MASGGQQPPWRQSAWSKDPGRRLRIMSERRVTSIFAGAYKSVFRGRGIEFEELCDYQPGDDIRCIDWNVTARTGRPCVKRFIEEREMTVMLLLDHSASLECPAPRGAKSRVAVELCALLAFAAVRSNDRVGLITFSKDVERYIPPGKGKRHAQRLISELVGQQAGSGGTNLAGALDYLQRVARRPVILFVISDFLNTGYHASLTAVARRHDVVAVAITDPHDRQLPEVGLLWVTDAENGRRQLVDTGSALIRQLFASHAARRWDELNRMVASAGAELLEVSTVTPPVQALSRFFQLRQHRRRR